MSSVVLPRFAGIRPAAVLPCATDADVVAALGTARAGGHAVAVRGGGHCFAGRSSGTGVVIDTGPMTGVEIDGNRAVIGAGTRLAQVYDDLAAAGRTIPAGCGPTVGVAGLTLGGGLGILGRRYGLTCDHLVAARLVLADGRVIDAGADLLWLLRGGGAPGVVCSLAFRTVPAPDSTAFRLGFPAGAAVDIVEAWPDAVPHPRQQGGVAQSIAACRSRSISTGIATRQRRTHPDISPSRPGERPASGGLGPGGPATVQHQAYWLPAEVTSPTCRPALIGPPWHPSHQDRAFGSDPGAQQ